MIELQEYDVNCPHCAKEFILKVNDVDGMADDIEDACLAAARNERYDVEREFDGYVDHDDLPIQPQTMKELAAAIRMGERFVAEILLDLVAYDLGTSYTEAVENGRYGVKELISP